MSSPKLVTVYGATGAQGGSVVRSLLKNGAGTFKVRGITRNPHSAAAKALAASGVEVITADGAKIDEMERAFQGSWAVFANTNSDDPALQGPEAKLTETDLGKTIVDAAVRAGVERFIYSGMASASKVTDGKVPSLAFDEKNAIASYAQAQPAFASAVNISAGWYLENFLNADLAPIFGGFPHVPADDGTLVLRTPSWGGDERIPFIAIGADFGDLVHGILLAAPERYHGRMVHAYSDARTAEDVVAAFERVVGKRARHEVMSEGPAGIETYGMSALVTVRDMFAWVSAAGGNYYGEPNDGAPALELKRLAVEAQGGAVADARLMTVEDFWEKVFLKM